MTWEQTGFDVRMDWGPTGLDSLLGGGVRTVVVVDVLRFTTAVDVACSRGARVTPFPSGDEAAAAEEAKRIGATAASRRMSGGDVSSPSLSPVSLRLLTPADHVLLPSPNGSAIARRAATAGVNVLAGCLRNADAVAAAIVDLPVGIVAAGERWPDGSLRPAVEDLWGAGAIAAALAPRHADPLALLGLRPPVDAATRTLSPEAEGAARSVPTADAIVAAVQACASGVELEEKGWGLDVEVAAALGTSTCVPILGADGAFRAA